MGGGGGEDEKKKKKKNGVAVAAENKERKTTPLSPLPTPAPADVIRTKMYSYWGNLAGFVLHLVVYFRSTSK